MSTRICTFFVTITLLLTAAPPGFAADAGALPANLGAEAANYDARILRDTWGVPHIFGKTDADAAFGLAYAHAEDDWPTIEDTVISARAKGGKYSGADAAAIDYIIHLMKVWDHVNAKYETDLSAETRAICEAYAEGLNLYASKHPEEIKAAELLPYTGKDIVAGFVFRSPFFYGLDRAVRDLMGEERRHEVSRRKAAQVMIDPVEGWLEARDFLTAGAPAGSNTIGVAPSRTPDGSTYLAVNSHQPWEGPVAWYEAHVRSDDGWDAVGGTFPGAPLILHGHNRHLGWAHTVNSPDLVDIFVLEMNPDNPDQYKFDGEWRDLEKGEASLEVKILPDKPTTMKVRREILSSVHGPVMRTDHGVYAIKYASMGDIRHVEQWYRMNRAASMDEWLDAMRMQAIASLNCGYADKEGNILYLYNALIPKRSPHYDWEQYLPGNTSETLWTGYVDFDAVPILKNPPSGFFQNCNSTPFETTVGDTNPDPEDFPAWFGIETHMTNRALRAVELFGADESITWDEFKTYKYDMGYSDVSFMARMLDAILVTQPSDEPLLSQGLALLRDWDRQTAPDSRAAALAIMTGLPHHNNSGHTPQVDEVLATLRESAKLLRDTHGRIDPEWQEVNRLHRGDVNLGLGGGPDILHAVYGRLDEESGTYTGRTGDCYVLLVRWDEDGHVHSESIHQYGSATSRPDSPHYADQAPLFVQRQLKPVWLDESDIRAHLEAEYRAGDER